MAAQEVYFLVELVGVHYFIWFSRCCISHGLQPSTKCFGHWLGLWLCGWPLVSPFVAFGVDIRRLGSETVPFANGTFS